MTIYPALRYQDPDAALTWLAKAFGFEEHNVSRTTDGTFQHAELRLGGSLIMISAARDEESWLGGHLRPECPECLIVDVERPEGGIQRTSADQG